MPTTWPNDTPWKIRSGLEATDAQDAVRWATRRPPVAAHKPSGGAQTEAALCHMTFPTSGEFEHVSMVNVYIPVDHVAGILNGAPEPAAEPQLQDPGVGVWMFVLHGRSGLHPPTPNDQLPLLQIPVMLPVNPTVVVVVVTDAPSAAPGTG